jgi:uncharacterized NAD-dependent epimerase/dehydratase family protein
MTATPRIKPCITKNSKLALLMHNSLVGGWGKMGIGLLRYSEAEITAVIDREYAGKDLRTVTGIDRTAPIVATVAEAAALGADTLVPGVATPNGVLPEDWWPEIQEALASGMSLVNGLHAPLAERPDLKELLLPGRFIWDVRREPDNLQNGLGRAASLPAKRVLTVGTDMAIGKMTASIELDRAARARGLRSRFLASGQIGICIAGEGVALDAVRVDFATGAVESMMMQYGNDHDMLFLEGQGSMLHPASTAWLALMRGGCPTHLILVHRAGQDAIGRAPHIKIPPLKQVAELYEAVSSVCGSMPTARVAGIALNCYGMSDDEARMHIEATHNETGLPTTDVVRFGCGELLDSILME